MPAKPRKKKVVTTAGDPETEPNVLTPKKLQDATDQLVDASNDPKPVPNDNLSATDHDLTAAGIRDELLNLPEDKLSPYEKYFVQSVKDGMGLNPKNLSTATMIVKRYNA